jgi:hypothetical protein|tara:strand:+ start:176 stop:466 length:291 start_codon:yes stop_codon:yes gene_type:complete
MAKTQAGIKKELYAEMSKDLSTFSKDFVAALRTTTPIDTGRARQGWQNTFNGINGRKIVPLAKNHVPYIGVLDTNKTSRQAPNGIVEVALRKATGK